MGKYDGSEDMGQRDTYRLLARGQTERNWVICVIPEHALTGYTWTYTYIYTWTCYTRICVRYTRTCVYTLYWNTHVTHEHAHVCYSQTCTYMLYLTVHGIHEHVYIIYMNTCVHLHVKIYVYIIHEHTHECCAWTWMYILYLNVHMHVITKHARTWSWPSDLILWSEKPTDKCTDKEIECISQDAKVRTT